MGWEQPHLACSEELPLAAAPAGYQLIFQEAIPGLAARELLVLQVLLAGGLETGCESIQVSGTVEPVYAHLGRPGSADLFRGSACRFSARREDLEGLPPVEAFLRRV